MSYKIPRRYCRGCSKYNAKFGCTLNDLEPCIRSEEVENERAKDTFLAVVTLFALAVCMFILLYGCTPKPPEPKYIPKFTTMELLRMKNHELSSFDKMTLAIALTESRFNPDADSGQGDNGLLQLRSVYIDEVNRLYGTNYTVEDAYDIEKSIEMFRLMQDAYNPTKDIEKAIYFHNKSVAYKLKALQNYELICRMEEVRAKLIRK